MKWLDRLLGRDESDRGPLTVDDRLKFDVLHRQEHARRKLLAIGIEAEIVGRRVGENRNS